MSKSNSSSNTLLNNVECQLNGAKKISDGEYLKKGIVSVYHDRKEENKKIYAIDKVVLNLLLCLLLFSLYKELILLHRCHMRYEDKQMHQLLWQKFNIDAI